MILAAPIVQSYRPSVASASLLTLGSKVTLRSDLSGYVGGRIDTLQQGLWVTHIARWVVSGNTQTHTVKIANSSNATVASVSIITAGAAVGELFIKLPTEIFLAASSSFYLLGEEFSGGDQWYDNTVVTAATVVTYFGRAFDLGGGLNSSADSFIYGPYNLKYRT